MFKNQIIMPEHINIYNDFTSCSALHALSYLQDFYSIDLNTVKVTNITTSLILSDATLKKNPSYFFACGVIQKNKEWYYKAFKLLGHDKISKLIEIGNRNKFPVPINIQSGSIDIQQLWKKIDEKKADNIINKLFEDVKSELGSEFAYNIVFIAGLIPNKSIINGILERYLTIIPMPIYPYRYDERP